MTEVGLLSLQRYVCLTSSEVIYSFIWVLKVPFNHHSLNPLLLTIALFTEVAKGTETIRVGDLADCSYLSYGLNDVEMYR